jgi:HKD family nuclease
LPVLAGHSAHLRTFEPRAPGNRPVKTRVLGQFAGEDSIRDALVDLLSTRDFKRFRFLVAFVRWSGLDVLRESLESFVARKGKVDCIVGLDLGGTTIEALTYLAELPRTRCRVARSGNPSICFHPKLWMFDGPTRWTAIVGSSNGTAGGLYTNAELCVRIDGKASESNPFEDYWAQFSNPDPPLKPEHVEDVTERNLKALAAELEPYTKRPPDRGRNTRKAVPRIVPRVLLPAIGRPPEPASKKKKVGYIATPKADILYMEVWDETGGGTQVQFPKRVITDYFGAHEGTITWVTLKTPAGPEYHRIQMFPNSTFRIPLGFMAPFRRPAVARFERKGDDLFVVEVRSKGKRGYPTWLSKCTKRTSKVSKAYGFE